MNGELVPLVFECSLNGELFKEYESQSLAPRIDGGDIVIMNNRTSHKVKGVTALIRAAGADVVFLPPYSPDLKPIEMKWSKRKGH
ncbi:MAG: transposase [Synergistaceae bacterium]|nr:transposase [Synergistaceae bacterium]